MVCSWDLRCHSSLPINFHFHVFIFLLYKNFGLCVFFSQLNISARSNRKLQLILYFAMNRISSKQNEFNKSNFCNLP